MGKIFEEALRATFQFIGEAVRFFIGMVGHVSASALPPIMVEVGDELTTYSDAGDFPWRHVIKIAAPAIVGPLVVYITQHRAAAKKQDDHNSEMDRMRSEIHRLSSASGIGSEFLT